MKSAINDFSSRTFHSSGLDLNFIRDQGIAFLSYGTQASRIKYRLGRVMLNSSRARVANAAHVG